MYVCMCVYVCMYVYLQILASAHAPPYKKKQKQNRLLSIALTLLEHRNLAF